MYLYKSNAGAFHIVEYGGLFHPIFQGYDLGAYVTARHAADDLARGRTFKVPGLPDTTNLGIPSQLSQWHKLKGDA